MNLPDLIKKKVVSRKDIPGVFSAEFREGKTLVFTNGCFDILHKGHLHLLSSAKNQGDILIVALNTDSSVRKLKGPNRPVNNESTRTEIMASLVFVDYLVLFEEETPLEIIRCILPDVLVKGGDYKLEDIVGYDFVTSSGGKVITIPFLEGFSSSSLIDKIEQG